MATFYIAPFAPHGQTPEQREAELREYIRELVDQLNFTLSSLDEENLSEGMNKGLEPLPGGSTT